MNDVDTKAQIMRAIGRFAENEAVDCSSPAFWQDIVQACAAMIFEVGKTVDYKHLETLMWLGHAAHRQSKAARLQTDGGAAHG